MLLRSVPRFGTRFVRLPSRGDLRPVKAIFATLYVASKRYLRRKALVLTPHIATAFEKNHPLEPSATRTAPLEASLRVLSDGAIKTKKRLRKNPSETPGHGA